MVERLSINLVANPNKVILQNFDVGEKRSKILIEKVLNMDDNHCKESVNHNLKLFEARHPNYKEQLLKNFQTIYEKYDFNKNISEFKRLLIGSYFSKEYSIQSAALFNPSIVRHPDQSDITDGDLKFIMSLRATGEGHISSIVFREGKISSEGKITLDEESKYSVLAEYKISANGGTNIYSCEYSESSKLSERVLFPYTAQESMGMEDVRFVRFEDNGKYFGTYTAYNGRSFTTQLLETSDFRQFIVSKLNGNAIKDKGMALFPRKIYGSFYMISRQDGFNIHIMKSKDLYNWEKSEIIKSPQLDWELMQLGNCGSPIETDDGWLLITHAVGLLRRYVISAVLLDLHEPSKIIGQLTMPLIEPNEDEREGYVPNVVYSCGSLIHEKYLVIPYAMSDSSCGFAKMDLKKLLRKVKEKN